MAVTEPAATGGEEYTGTTFNITNTDEQISWLAISPKAKDIEVHPNLPEVRFNAVWNDASTLPVSLQLFTNLPVIAFDAQKKIKAGFTQLKV